MNDRYLYRAKRTDNGEWVDGYLFDDGFENGRMFVGGLVIEEYHGTASDDWSITGVDFYEVDQFTICQCTSLKDKNGKLIWENDICRRILLPTKRIEKNFRIAYVPYKCCLSAIDLDGSNITFLSDYINNQYEVEVIGSAIDNQELLEVGE